MKKSLFAAFLIVTLVCISVEYDTVRFGVAQSGTSVSGIIGSDITWALTGSPYNLGGNILVNSGVTVTVGAGTTLNLDGFYIIDNGSLIIQEGVTVNMGNANAYILANGVLSVIGTNANPIQINGNVGHEPPLGEAYYSTITFSITSTGWNDATNSGSIIENAIIKLTFISISNSVKLTNNTFLNGVGVSGGSPLITDNAFETGITVEGGSPVISNNIIDSSITWLEQPVLGSENGQTAFIDDNTISGGAPSTGGIALAGSSLGCNLIIERNLITSNSYAGIDIAMWAANTNCTASIINNTIINNAIGIYIIIGYPQAIVNNNIYSNNDYDLKLSNNAPVDATNDWWGTTDTQAINQTIYDFKDDFTLGTVNFVPFLTSENPEAMPNLNGSIPILTPSPSPTPSISPTQTSTPSPSPTSSPIITPSSSIPEFPTLTILALTATATLLAAFFIKRKLSLSSQEMVR